MWSDHRGSLSTAYGDGEILIRGLIRIHECINLNHCQNAISKKCYIISDIINQPHQRGKQILIALHL